MSDSTASLRRKISGAEDLQAVVRTMKAVAASSIGQYENSVRALNDYYRTVQMGLGACFRDSDPTPLLADAAAQRTVGAIVFGSDQGLVGQFNDVIADFAIRTLKMLPGQAQIWAVGERVHARLTDAGLHPAGLFSVPNSVRAITPLVGQILVAQETGRPALSELHLFYNGITSGAAYAPVSQRLLPLDESWRRKLSQNPWLTKNLPEVIGSGAGMLRALIREYLFVSHRHQPRRGIWASLPQSFPWHRPRG